MIALKLAKAGYFGGDPAAVLTGRVDMVLDAIAYEKFLVEYQDAYDELNKPN